MTKEQKYRKYMGQPLTDERSGQSVFYLLAGGVFGAGLALLFAPKPGNEFRQKVAETTKRRFDETLQMAHRLKDRSERVYKTIRDKSDKVREMAATLSNDDLGARSTSTAANNNALGMYDSKRSLSRKHLGSIRKSSSIV